MIKLLMNEGSRELTIREYAVMRDGTMVIKISDPTGDIKWVDAKDLEVLRI